MNSCRPSARYHRCGIEPLEVMVLADQQAGPDNAARSLPGSDSWLMRHVRKDEKKYYDELIQHSREHLMLFPYHLSDVMVRKLRFTPFRYYLHIMQDTMEAERSYDSLPNFTAADCLRLLGIGRNQYIDLMNQCRSKGKFFRRGKPVQALLPTCPVEQKRIDSWWVVFLGFVTEDDIKMCSAEEVKAIDSIIDVGPRVAGHMNRSAVLKLHNKGLIYLDVPLEDGDYIIVPPLEGFVMNRVQGDYFETLLYKIFVSIAEHTTIAELASILQIDLQLVKNAVSVFIRLGFAKKRGAGIDRDSLHPTWEDYEQSEVKVSEGPMLLDVVSEGSVSSMVRTSPVLSSRMRPGGESPSGYRKRIGFLFDSTLTAFLMMGNLSQGLKSHAVTMFEVGKLPDESMGSFLTELDKVDAQSTSEGAEGEAQRYFHHAITLNHTLHFLRFNPKLCPSDGSPLEAESGGVGLDLLRCESLNGLDAASCSRLLNKNYSLLVSMAPLSQEIQPVTSVRPQHMGPPIAEVSSVWFKLWLYSELKAGPPSLLLVKGTRLRKLPPVFQPYRWLLITTWGHDPTVVSASNVLLALNEALSHSAVLLQAYGVQEEGAVVHIPFPLDEETLTKGGVFSQKTPWFHSAVQTISKCVDVQHSCGFISLLRTGGPRAEPLPEGALFTGTPSHYLSTPDEDDGHPLDDVSFREKEWVPLDLCFGIPLFDSDLNDAILKKMVEFQICNKDSLEKLLESNRLLSLRLLHFISTHQDSPLGVDHGADATPGSLSDSTRELPLPTWNLMFNNGQLQRQTIR